MRRRHKKNRRPWKGGFQTYVEVNGVPRHKSWPATASDEEMDEWVADQRREKVAGPKGGSFAADVEDFKSRIAASRTYKQLAAYLNNWLTALGRDRPRRTIKARDIDQTLQTWEAAGMGGASLQKHRMILMALWNRLDGKGATNPVRATKRPQVPKPEARDIPYDDIVQIVEAMPERTEKQRASRRRIAVLAFTGIPPGMLGTLTPGDVDIRGATIRVTARRKGRGVEARTLPLVPDGLAALRRFHQHQDYGTFRVDVLNRAFKKAAASLDISGVTLYDLRHSFATAMYKATKDLDTVARFLQHSSTALTQRYAKGALDDVNLAAAQALGRSLSRKPVPTRRRPMKNEKK